MLCGLGTGCHFEVIKSLKYMLLIRICLHGALDKDEYRKNPNCECQLVQVTRKTPFGFILFKNPSKGYIKDLGGSDLAPELHIYTPAFAHY